MDSGALFVLLAIAATSDARSPATFREAFGSLRTPWSYRDVSADLLQVEEPTPTDTSNSDGSGPDFDFDRECSSLVDIFHFMNTTGCLDENSDIIANRPGREVNIADFCSTCDVQAVYDMASAVEPACYNNSQLAEGIRMIVPIYGAMCTQDANLTYCAAPFFLQIFGDDGDDSGLSEAERDERNAAQLAALEMACESTCPYWETMLNFSYDCFQMLPMFGSMCVKDLDRHCIGSLDGDVYWPDEATGAPHFDAVERFCGDPCGGAIVEFWQDEAIALPECVSDFFPQPVNPSTLCVRREADHLNCMAEVIPTVNDTLEACDFTGVPAEWTCDGACRTSAANVLASLDCCSEMYFTNKFGADLLSDVDRWITNTCTVADTAGDCTNDYTEPQGRPECVAARERNFSLQDALRCMIEYHTMDVPTMP